MKKIELTFDELKDRIKKGANNKLYITVYEFENIFEKDQLRYIKDIEEQFPEYRGVYYADTLSGIVLFPLDEDYDILFSSIKRLDAEFAKQLNQTIEEYEKTKQDLEESIEHMTFLVKKQRMRNLFN